MSTQPTPGALSAAQETIATIRHDYADRLCPDAVIAKIIDQKAVKPATAELLAALLGMADSFDIIAHNLALHKEYKFQTLADCCRASEQEARAAIAKHEGRT